MKFLKAVVPQHLTIRSIASWISLVTVLLLSLNIIVPASPIDRVNSYCLFLAVFSLVYLRLFRWRWPSMIAGLLILLLNTLLAATLKDLFTEIPMMALSGMLILLSLRKKDYDNLAHIILLPLITYLYVIPVQLILGVNAPYTLFNISAEINGGLGIFFMCVSILLFYPKTWLTAVYTSKHTGSGIARKLLLGFITMPLIIGWLRLMGERTGIITSEFGIIIVAITYTFGLLCLAWFIVQPYNKREKLLQHSRDQYRMLAEMSPYAILVNRNGIIAYINPSALKLFHAENPFQVIGTPVLDLFMPAYHSIIKDRINLLQNGYQVPINEMKIRCLDGSIRDVEAIGSAFHDEEGQAFQVILHDITEHKKAQAIMFRYQLISRHARDPLIMFDVHGKIMECNQAANDFYGYPHAEFLKLNVFDLRGEESKPLVEDQMAKARKGGILFETVHKLKNGTLVPVEVSSRGVMIDGQEMLLSVIRDITERKKRENELLRSNQTLMALEKCNQAVVRASSENELLKEICRIIISDCNYTMIWIGYALEDAEKTVLPMVHSGFDRGYLESMRISWADTERGRGPTGTAIRTGKPYICRNMLTDPAFLPWREEALKRGYASSIALPLAMGEDRLGAIGIYSREPDSFAEKEVELLTELANDITYGIIAIRWKTAREKAEAKLKESAERLLELNATKDKFFGIIAHDLKNPFVGILGASELLIEQNNFDAGQTRDLIVLLHKAAKNGYSILENLLEWSRAQTGRLQMNPQLINIKNIIVQNVENLAMTASNKNIIIHIDAPEQKQVNADPNMISTVLRNLLSNAIKFSFCFGTVEIKAQEKEGEVVITVNDNGIGIPESELQNLFKIDIQYLQIGTEEERGTGLGLILCKEFVEKHGGRIWVESREKVGSSFNFTIPLLK